MLVQYIFISCCYLFNGIPQSEARYKNVQFTLIFYLYHSLLNFASYLVLLENRVFADVIDLLLKNGSNTLSDISLNLEYSV